MEESWQKLFLWIEKRNEKESYIFGVNFMKQLCSDVIVESKKIGEWTVFTIEAYM